MNLVNGRWLNGFDAKTVERDMADIGPLGLVRGLVRTKRFHPSGPPQEEWNVAAHSMLTALVFIRMRGYFDWPHEWLANALLHDAHESFTGDMVRPVKKLLTGVRELEERIDRGLAAYFGVDYGGDAGVEEAVRLCDTVALLLEAQEWGLPLELHLHEISSDVRKALTYCGGDEWPVRHCDPVEGE